ncbi:MAG: hypothetical protein JKY65_01250, partial [Planctomycetes bacterium]|nr:hypothetical protein [Planctomycetota bacterium]
AESLDAGGARRGRRHRQRAVTWVEAKSLSAGDELTQKIGARLRLRLELYDPEQEAKDRLRLAAERIEAEPLLAAEAQEAATLALADCLTKILVAKTPDPNAAHHLRKLAMECGGQVLELGTAQAFEQGATEWILAFTDARSPHLRVAMLNTLASVRGHGDRAVQPGPRYVRAFFAAVSTGEAVERMVVTAIWDGVVPGFRPPASFYAVFLGLAMRPDTFDLESLLFSLRALPGSGSHIAIAPSLRGALDRFEDPGGPRAPLSERYKRFVLHFGALTKQHRYKRSRGMRLMQLVAMQRARYHADPKLIDQYVGLARVICDRSGQSSLVDDLSEPWQALALLKLAEGLGELAKFTRDRLQDPSLATSERDRLKRKLEAVIKEGLKAGQAAEGRVLAQRAAAPFSAQAEFSTDGNVRLAIWTRAAEALRKGLAEAHAANHLVMHYEDGLATILRRGARELLGLGRYDEALAWAEECAEVARKAAGIKRNESLNSAVGIMAQVYRRRGELDKAEQALSERLETGLETDDFAFVAAQVAWERGDHEEAIRRAARGLKENFRNRGLTQLLEKYKAKLAELRKREDEK